MWTLAECGHCIQDPLHRKLHHATKYQAVMWFPQFYLPGQSLSYNISKFRGLHKNWPNMAILVAICFKVLCIILRNFRPITEILKRPRTVTLSLGPVSSLFWKFQSAVERAKIDWAWLFQKTICFMLLCIIPPNFRLIAEILKELRW